MKKRLVIADMYRKKNKIAFFAIHQAITILKEFDIEFHILWDQPDYVDEWTRKINELGATIVDYTKEQLNEYCLDYGIPQSLIDRFPNFKSVYFVIHAHYLKSNNISNYYLIYDDDIILKEDIWEFKYCLANELPCLIAEPMNFGCDKSMIQHIFYLYDGAKEKYQQLNPNGFGFNAGIQGISLDIFEDFLSRESFLFLLNMFNYDGIYDKNGKEITGPARSMIDTQQQSFFSIMNVIKPNNRPVILNPMEYFVCPNWGHHPVFGEINPENEYGGWDVNMKSKIVHFIGHTALEGIYYGKPKQYHKLVDEYLKKHNVL